MKRILLMGLSVLFVSAVLISRSGGGVAHAVTYQRFCDYSGSGLCLDAAGGGPGVDHQTVQLYDEGQTSGEWHVLNFGSVTGSGEWPFTPGQGYNTAFSGDAVIEMEYAPNGVASGYCDNTYYSELVSCTGSGTTYNNNALQVLHGSNQQYIVSVYGTNQNSNYEYPQFANSTVLWAAGNTDGTIPNVKLGETGNNWEEWSQP